MDYELEFRDEVEQIDGPSQVDLDPPANVQTSAVDQTMAQGVTPGASVQQAASIVGQFSGQQQQAALLWLSQHHGALFAGQVAGLLEGDGGLLDQQLGSLGTSATEAISAQQTSAFSFGIQEQTAAEQSKDSDNAGKEVLASYNDPLLGDFQVLFDVDNGVSARLMDGVVTVFSTSGLTLRTPGNLPDITMKLVRMDMKTGDVEIISDPELGPFEEKIISEGLRTTMLAGMTQAESQADLASVLGLEVNKDGQIPLYESFWADVYLDASTSITTKLSDKSFWIYFSKPIFADILGPVNLHLMAIEYNFATASIDLIPSADGNMVSVGLEEMVSRLGESFGNDFIRDKMPAAMKKAGYSPKADPDLQKHFNELLVNLGIGESAAQNTVTPQKGSMAPAPQQSSTGAPAPVVESEKSTETSAPASASEVESKEPELDYQPLYTVETSNGTIAVAVDKEDSLDISKSPTELRLGASNGLFVVAPGADWARQLRIFDIRYGLADGELEINASEQVGELVTEVLESLIRTQVLPKMPGEVLSKLGVDQEPIPLNELGELEVLYATEVAGMGQVQLLADNSDTVNISRGPSSLEMSSAQGIRIRVMGADWIPELVLGSLKYNTESGDIAISPPSNAQGDAALDLGPLTERAVEALVRTQLLPLMPGQVRESAGMNASTEAQQVPEAQGNVILSDSWGALGEVDVSLVPGDAIGFKNGPDMAVATIKQGLMVRIPKLGFTVRIYELGYDPATGKAHIQSDPQLGSYEEALIGGALGEFVMPQLQAWIAQNDQDLTDSVTVLYRADIEGFGKLKICVEAGDTIALQEDADALRLSSDKGIFWLAEGDLGELLPTNRINEIRLDLNTGDLTIDAQADIGPLGEQIATRVVHMMALPKLDAGLRQKIFGGKDPIQQDLPEVPDAGEILYEGEAGGMAYDVSLRGGRLSVASDAQGFFDINGHLLLRVPSMGVAVSLMRLRFDPQSGQIHNLATNPAVGAGELGIIEKAINHFAGPLIAEYTQGQRGDGARGLRTIASFQGHALKVSAGDALSVERNADFIEVSAPGGILLESSYLEDAPPRIQAIRYHNGTGQILIDLVDTRDNTVYKDATEVAGLTQDALSAITRRMLDPHLTPEMRALGLAGVEAQPTVSAGPRRNETTWFSMNNDLVGRVSIYTRKDDQINVSADPRSFNIKVPNGARLVLPDLGISQTFYAFYYHIDTGDIAMEGLGRLETTLARNVARQMLGPMLAKSGVNTNNQQGMAAQLRDQMELRKKKDNVNHFFESDGIGLYIPTNCVMKASLSGNGIHIKFTPKIWIDGPSVGNFYLDKVKYNFATGKAEIDIDGSNLLSAIFEGIGEDKATEPLQQLMNHTLPPAMRQPGYNLFTDPNKQANLETFFSNLGEYSAQTE